MNERFDQSLTIGTSPRAIARALESATGLSDVRVMTSDDAVEVVNQLLHLLHIETDHLVGGITLRIRCEGATLVASDDITVRLRAQSEEEVTFSDYRHNCAQCLTQAALALQKALGDPADL